MSIGKIAIQLNNVGIFFKDSIYPWRKSGRWVLKDLSFDIRYGETLGIIGRNGTGKSTLMRLIAGIISPDSGTITREGLDVLLLSLQVGFLAHLSGRENAVISGILLGMDRDEVKRKLDDIIDFADLGEYIDHPVRHYSSGMRARLGFAVAIQADPEVLLVDEVLGVGDAQFRLKSRQAMLERIESNRTVIIVSHQEETIKENCDRVIWIDDGVVRASGSPENVVAEYKAHISGLVGA